MPNATDSAIPQGVEDYTNWTVDDETNMRLDRLAHADRNTVEDWNLRGDSS